MNTAWGRGHLARFFKLSGFAGLMVSLLIFLVIYVLIGTQLHNPAVINGIVLRPDVGPNEFYDKELVAGIKKQSFFINCRDGSKIHCWLYRVP